MILRESTQDFNFGIAINMRSARVYTRFKNEPSLPTIYVLNLSAKYLI